LQEGICGEQVLLIIEHVLAHKPLHACGQAEDRLLTTAIEVSECELHCLAMVLLCIVQQTAVNLAGKGWVDERLGRHAQEVKQIPDGLEGAHATLSRVFRSRCLCWLKAIVETDAMKTS